MRRKVAYTSRLKEGSPGEERGESAAVEAAEIRSGTEATPAGPTTTGPAGKPIPAKPGVSVAGPAATKPPETPIPRSNGASVAGPVATLPPDTPIPHAGRGTDASSSGAKGGPSPHPQNAIATTRAGSAQHGAKGGAVDRPIDKAKPAATAKQPNPVGAKRESGATPKKDAKGSNRFTGGERKNLGHFLGKVAKGTGRPI